MHYPPRFLLNKGNNLSNPTRFHCIKNSVRNWTLFYLRLGTLNEGFLNETFFETISRKALRRADDEDALDSFGSSFFGNAGRRIAHSSFNVSL